MVVLILSLKIRNLIVLLLIKNHTSQKAQSEERDPKKRSRNRKQKDRFQKRERDKGQPAKTRKQDRLLKIKKQRRQTTNVIL